MGDPIAVNFYQAEYDLSVPQTEKLTGLRDGMYKYV